MTKMFRFTLALIAFVCMYSLSVIDSGAAVTHGKYKDAYTNEDNSGNWTFTGSTFAIQGTFQARYAKTHVISNTPATLTTAKSGIIYIIDGGGTIRGASHSTIVTVTLPVAATGLHYTFISGDGSGIVLRTSDSNHALPSTDLDILMYGLNGASVPGLGPTTNTSVRLTKNARGATGTSITVVGATGKWYMYSNAATDSTLTVETRSADPKYRSYTY